MALEPLNRMEPEARRDVAGIFRTVSQALALVVGVILSLVGIYLLLDVYFTVASFVESPVTLEPLLAAWDTALRGEVSPPPVATVDANPPFMRFVSDLIAQLSEGNLARPIGGFILFLFMTVMFRIALGLLGAGTKMLLGMAMPGSKAGKDAEAG